MPQQKRQPCKKHGTQISVAELAFMLLFVERRNTNPGLTLADYRASLDAILRGLQPAPDLKHIADHPDPRD
jgi:hypothetical protein